MCFVLKGSMRPRIKLPHVRITMALVALLFIFGLFDQDTLVQSGEREALRTQQSTFVKPPCVGDACEPRRIGIFDFVSGPLGGSAALESRQYAATNTRGGIGAAWRGQRRRSIAVVDRGVAGGWGGRGDRRSRPLGCGEARAEIRLSPSPTAKAIGQVPV